MVDVQVPTWISPQICRLFCLSTYFFGTKTPLFLFSLTAINRANFHALLAGILEKNKVLVDAQHHACPEPDGICGSFSTALLARKHIEAFKGSDHFPASWWRNKKCLTFIIWTPTGSRGDAYVAGCICSVFANARKLISDFKRSLSWLLPDCCFPLEPQALLIQVS